MPTRAVKENDYASADKSIGRAPILVDPGGESQDYQTANFLNAINQVVSFFASTDCGYYLEDENIVDALNLYAKQYQRDQIG